jgi:hypothetical protein
LRHLDVLLLVLADRHERASTDEDVGRHEHRMVEEPHLGLEAFDDFVFVARGALEEPLAADAGDEPRELRHFDDERERQRGGASPYGLRRLIVPR